MLPDLNYSADIIVIGGGLSGIEVSHFLARKGLRVTLFEMKPTTFSPAHKDPGLGELVCSNSFKSKELENAHGLLKREIEILGSLVIKTAHSCSIPAGKALAVDRQKFSNSISDTIENHENITVIRHQVSTLDDMNIPTVVCAGPLISDQLFSSLEKMIGRDSLYFYDAISPIVDFSTVDRSIGFWQNRYDEKGHDYFNIPMDKSVYERFIEELLGGETVQSRDFEELKLFKGCSPIEDIARGGKDSLRYGALKPVGLFDPHTGNRPYAVIQLRKENDQATRMTMVGFQTRLRHKEQKRIFGLIPGCSHMGFFRFGSLHRNSYIHSPGILEQGLRLKSNNNIFIAGALCGAEGYIESAATGLYAAISVWKGLQGRIADLPPKQTMLGGLVDHIINYRRKGFQPMNANFGLIENYSKNRKIGIVKNAIEKMQEWATEAAI